MTANTVKLHRVLPTTPAKIFRAFTQGDALAQWLPPYGFTAHVDAIDVRVGGTYRMSFTNFTTGQSQSFGGTYHEVVADERLHYSDAFDDPNLPGEMLTTVELRAVPMGTELNIVQQGIPDAIPVEACYLGWQDSLDKLMRLVVPEIKD
jgi:uncharacterized protein YndB with AHSA1/START domain